MWSLILLDAPEELRYLLSDQQSRESRVDVDNAVEETDLLLKIHFLVHFLGLSATALAPSDYCHFRVYFVV